DLGSMDPSALYFYLYASNDTNPGPAVFERVSISQESGVEAGTAGEPLTVEEDFIDELDEETWGIYDNDSGADAVVEDGELRIENLGTDGWDTNQKGIFLRQALNLANNVTTVEVDYLEAGWSEQNPGFWTSDEIADDLWNHPGFRLTVSGEGVSPTFTPAADGSFEPGFSVTATPPYTLRWVLTHEEGSTVAVEVYVDDELQGESEMDLGSMDPSALYFYLYASNDANPGPAAFERVSVSQAQTAAAAAAPVQDPEAVAAAAEQAQRDAQTQVAQTGLNIEPLMVDEDLSVLMFTRTEGFRHGSIETAHEVMERLAEERGFAVTITEDATVFTDDNLAQYDVIMFGVTTGSVLQPQQREAMIRFIRGGGGFVGVHSASDTHYDWEWYGDLVGAYFNGHPPGTQNARLVVEDPVHPSVAHLGGELEINDEWYFWDANPREGVHVLMTLDRSSHPVLAGFAAGDPEADHPVTWCHPYQGGRSWYTALGHPDWVWEDERFQEMLMGGILWTARQVEGSCDVDFNQIIIEPLVEGMNEPMNLEVDNQGRVFYVERPGNVRVWDEAHGVRDLLELDVYTEEEHGLLGLALDPDFADNGYVYLYYSPLAHETDNFLSRFTLAQGEDGDLALDPASEEILLQVYSDRETCCHQAGNLVFGPDGTLYLGTGDNTNPFESQGYSPIDRREGREYFSAIRSSGNPNDLRGKILRINKDGSIPEDNPFVDDPEVRDEI
ncbi:MAG: ThuA domain-containing protein, partial [Deinococcota bacterium]|nr:ThuA domain-containing protein [Deinococcota bacterium]